LGDIATQRISIEEGAYFKGGVDIQREAQKVPAQPRVEAKPESKPAAGSPVASSPSPQGSVSSANREPGKL
jgi:cytoskeletal protein CcmA (bactofilin family)